MVDGAHMRSAFLRVGLADAGLATIVHCWHRQKGVLVPKARVAPGKGAYPHGRSVETNNQKRRQAHEEA